MQKQQQSKKQKNMQTKPKAKARRRKKATNGLGDQKVSAPVAVGVIDTKLSQGMRFGAAAPHDDFPEGGCRLSGDLPNTSDDSLGASSVAGVTAAWSKTAGGGTAFGGVAFAVSPTARLNAGSNWPGYNMFGASSPIGVIAQYFTKFRFRKLELVYESTCATAQTGSIQFCYDLDAATVSAQAGNGSPQTFIATSRGARFPAWTPRVVVPLLEAMRSSGGDLLYGCSAVNVSQGTTSNGSINTLFQGAVTAFTDLAGGNVIFGRYRWRFILDLYGFRNYVGDSGLARAVTIETGKEEKASAEPDSPVLIHPLSVKSRHFDDNGREKKEEASSQQRAASKK